MTKGLVLELMNKPLAAMQWSDLSVIKFETIDVLFSENSEGTANETQYVLETEYVTREQVKHKKDEQSIRMNIETRKQRR